MTTLAASLPPVERGGLQSVSRAGVVLLLVLAVANGAFLYLVPARAAGEYAWSINPPICAAFLGAGYLAGTVATALVVFGTRWWRSLRVLPLALAVLSVTLLAATLIHSDRFRWDYAPTWIWVAVYAGVPFALAYLWWEQERAALPEPPADPRAVRRAHGLRGARRARARGRRAAVRAAGRRRRPLAVAADAAAGTRHGRLVPADRYRADELRGQSCGARTRRSSPTPPCSRGAACCSDSWCCTATTSPARARRSSRGCSARSRSSASPPGRSPAPSRRCAGTTRHFDA